MKIYVLNLYRVRGLVRAVSFLLSILVIASALVYTAYSLVPDGSYLPVAGDGETERVIIIDAGHGGEDSGAVGVNGALEKDLNLAIAMLLGEELTARGYTVVYTRTEDKMLYSEDENIKGMRKLSDLKNRCKIAEEHPGALLISVHMNSYGSAKYSGLQVYYTKDNEKSNALAMKIQSAVRDRLQPENNRTVKSGEGLYLLEKSPVTSVIVECGFLTNSAECEKLSEKEYQKQLSFAVLCGIIEYIEETD